MLWIEVGFCRTQATAATVVLLRWLHLPFLPPLLPLLLLRLLWTSRKRPQTAAVHG